MYERLEYSHRRRTRKWLLASRTYRSGCWKLRSKVASESLKADEKVRLTWSREKFRQTRISSDIKGKRNLVSSLKWCCTNKKIKKWNFFSAFEDGVHFRFFVVSPSIEVIISSSSTTWSIKFGNFPPVESRKVASEIFVYVFFLLHVVFVCYWVDEWREIWRTCFMCKRGKLKKKTS